MTLVSKTAALLVAAGTLIAWQVVKRFVLRSPLDNIPGPSSNSFLKGELIQMCFGSFFQLFGRHDWAFLNELSNDYGSVVKLRGLMGNRMLWVYDPKALHYIVVKEQESFQLSETSTTIRRTVFGPGLLGTLGDHHRRQRKLLNPVFSIANMRHLTPIFYSTIHRLRDGISKQLKLAGDGPSEIDLLNWMGRTALELIGQGGLGYSFDSLVDDEHNEFGDAIKSLAPSSSKTGLWRLVFMFSHYIPLPASVKQFLVGFIPNQGIKELKASVDFIDHMAHEIYNAKRKALLSGDEALKQQVGEGKDIMSVLLRANMEAAIEDRLPEDEVIAQMATLTFAGTDTTSNALSRILHILADRQDVQDKLRAEIVEARDGEDIPYDTLVELPFLDAVCRETLRLYPPVAMVTRGTWRDTIVPLSEPLRGTDGKWMDEIMIPKGTNIAIGIHACNRNKAIWGEDAHEWKPERWLSPMPDSITDARVPGVYSNLMTFLGGGRACIGFKFSQLEMKVVLSVLIESFKFTPSGKEIVWNRGGVIYPTVGKGSGRASLPMMVEVVKG